MMRRAAALLALTACDRTADPCAAVDGTCLELHLDTAASPIHELHLDLVWDGQHAASTQTLDPVALPAAIAITFPDPPPSPVRIDVVAGIAGSDLTVTATGHAFTTLVPNETAELRLDLAAKLPCDIGETYCGGIALAGDPQSVYTCTADLPLAHGRCPGACILHPTLGNTCEGVGGTCVTGGFYCGGDKLDGDPSTLYTCSATGTATNPTFCPLGCVVAPAGSDDHCRT